VIQPPAYLTGNKTSLFTSGTDDFEIGKNSSSSLVFTNDEIKSNKPLKHVKLDGSIIDYLTTNNLADLQSEDADELIALPGSILSAGDSLQKQNSPFPFALMDKRARVISRNLYDSDLLPNVMGYYDVDKPNSYAHGLCPAGANGTENYFLRRDGTWAEPNSAYSGTIQDSFINLQDTPTNYVANSVLIADYDVNFPQGIGIKQTKDLNIDTINCSGNITANSFISFSDETLKENIKNDINSLDEINSLEPKTYNFIDDATKRKRHGLLAQDVEKQLPELVITDKISNKKAVNYGDIISKLVGSVQLLDKKINDLNKQDK
jgi:hypothetical protein